MLISSEAEKQPLKLIWILSDAEKPELLSFIWADAEKHTIEVLMLISSDAEKQELLNYVWC